MAQLLIVHHTPSPAVDTMLQAVLDGSSASGLEQVDVDVRAALSATTSDVLAADGFIVGTPANLGYMSGALKHFFDTIYYPCLRQTTGRPFGMFVHGNNDADGAVRAIETVTTGLGWRPVSAPVVVTGEPDGAARDACWELGASVAATLSV